MGAYRYTVCDVFTDRPLAGNQLAVFTDAREIPEATLQPLAREVNFSETVYVHPPAADGHARVRIFTPASEVPFVGHPVLGTAFVLAARPQLAEIRLETGAGVVPVALERRGDRIGFGRMRQPVPTVSPFPWAGALLGALGAGRSRVPVELYDNGMKNVFVALESEEAVARLEPDLNGLVRLAREGEIPTIGVNCFAGAGRRWKTRMFAPADGVPEDPATGSAAGPLACHLARARSTRARPARPRRSSGWRWPGRSWSWGGGSSSCSGGRRKGPAPSAGAGPHESAGTRRRV